MAQPVVHRLEPVEVEVEDGDPIFGVPLETGQGHGQPVDEQRPVGQPGQAVMESAEGERLGLALQAVQLDEHRDLGPKDGRVERLEQVVDGADLVAAEHGVLVAAGRGQEDDRDVGAAVALLDHGRRLEAVDAGHLHVEDDHCEVPGQQMAQGLLPRPGPHHGVAEGFEHGLHGEQVLGAVVDEEERGVASHA